MPSGVRATKPPQLEIYYEQPWGGVASDKAAVDIGAGDLVKCDGITVRNGILCYTDITAKNTIYNLNTLNPPVESPYADNASGGLVEVAITSITPTDYDFRTGVYNGRIYTVATTINCYVGAVIGVSGTTNSVGDFDFNGEDQIDAIIDATHFHTATPYLSAYNGPPADVTGGEFAVFIQNNTAAGVGFVPVMGGGYVAFGAGNVPYNTAIPLPDGYTATNAVFFTTPGSAEVPGGNPLISGVYQSTVAAGVATSIFQGTAENPILNASSNYVFAAWTSSATVIQTTVGPITYVSFQTANGDYLCVAVGQNCANGQIITVPTGYTQANSINICGPASTVSTYHTMQGVQFSYTDEAFTTRTQYNDNQSNIWAGGSNFFLLFYAGPGITTTAVTSGTAVIVPTFGGTQLALFAGGGLQSGSYTSVPAGFSASTLSITAAMAGYIPHGDAEAVTWSACEFGGTDNLQASAIYNSYDDNWHGVVNFFGIVGTLFTPTPPAPITWAGISALALIFNVGNFLCGVDQFGFSYLATQKTDGTVGWNVDQTAQYAPSYGFGTPNAVKVVDGSAYICVYETNTLYKYTPQVAYVVATNYAAGKYIDIFDEYMLQLNTNSLAKDSSDGEQPTRVNWSSPDEFSTWDPVVNRTAGYQSITSAEDFITGFVAVDNVGYIFRRSGVTQITATGVAIQPFNFTTYWNSVIGQGLLFPGTLKQFGRFTFLTTDTAVYMFYGGSFTEISAKAAAAIYAQLEGQSTINSGTNDNVTGAISIYPLNDNIPVIHYILISTYSNVNPNVVFWFYNADYKCWTSVSRNLLDIIGAYTGTTPTKIIINFIRTSNVFLDYVVSQYYNNTPNYAVNLTLLNCTYTDETGTHTGSFVLYDIVNSPTSTDTFTPSTGGAINLLFRQEEIKLDREPTIRRVVIKASGSGVLTVSVSGVPFGTITLNGNQTPTTYKTPYGIYTGEDPQLSITCPNFNGQIVKVMLAGTYADGDID